MKTLTRFYIVDTVAEKVVGGFDVPNQTLAMRLFKEMLENNENLKKYPDSFKLCAERNEFESPETFDEVLSVTDFIS